MCILIEAYYNAMALNLKKREGKKVTSSLFFCAGGGGSTEQQKRGKDKTILGQEV